LVCLWCGRTVGRAYGHVTTKISRMHRSPNFLTHGAPLLTFRARESSTITTATIISSFQFVFIPQFTSLSSFFKKRYLCYYFITHYTALDCKTVRIFAYSSTREQSNKSSLASHALRACEARALLARKTFTPRFTDFFTDFEKKTDCFAV